MVIVLCTRGTGVGMMVHNGLEARYREYVNMSIQSWVENGERAVCMATSSARMMVRVSSLPAASM